MSPTQARQTDKTRQSEKAARAQANARGVPADIMLPRIMLLVSTILLVLIGLVMVFSASTVEAISENESVFSYVAKQALFVLIGAVLALVVARIPYRLWSTRPLFYTCWSIGLVLLVAVALIGTEALGAQRWLYIGSFSFQPTEFVKIILIIAAARIMCNFSDGIIDWKGALIRFAVLVVLPLAFLFKTQSDMGSALIIAFGVFAVAWLGEVPLKVILPVIGVVLVVALIAVSTGYRADRIAVWINPWNDGENGYGTGFQTIHSFYAFAEGGIFGVGLGNSREKFLYLPEAETDFIYSIIGEELGMIGALAVLILFLVFLYAGLRIAAKSPDEFSKLLAGGLTVMLVGQAFLNMACATGLFPTTGKPLPFISSGGSSVISSLIIVGLLMSVSYGSNVLTPYERRRNDLNVLRVERNHSGNEDGANKTDLQGARGRSSQFASLNSSHGSSYRGTWSRGNKTTRASQSRSNAASRDAQSRDKTTSSQSRGFSRAYRRTQASRAQTNGDARRTSSSSQRTRTSHQTSSRTSSQRTTRDNNARRLSSSQQDSRNRLSNRSVKRKRSDNEDWRRS